MAEPGTQAGQPACVRHPDRPTGLSCTRCGRPACPECLVDASVGYQCVDCVNEGRRTQRRATTVAGAETGTKPLLVPVLIAVNLAMFVLTALLAADFVDNSQSELFNALVGYPPSETEGQLWRLVTAGFLHFGVFHVAVNMLSLWYLRDVEAALGRWRFTAVYFLALIGGSAADYAFGELGARGAGASGAIYGVLGAFVVLVIRLKRARNPWLLVGGVIALTLVTKFLLPNTSLTAHLGGLVVGVALTVGFVYAPPALRRLAHPGVVGLVVLAIAGLFLARYLQLAPLIDCPEPTALVCFYFG